MCLFGECLSNFSIGLSRYGDVIVARSFLLYALLVECSSRFSF